jgi:integration host factor subunit beta
VNKSELIEKLAERSGLTVPQAEEVVNLIYRKMRDTMVDGGRIEIRGFGSFVVKEYMAYEGRNPKTGAKIYVAPKKLPFFKVGKELKERIDQVASAPPPEGSGSAQSNGNTP